MREPLAGQLKGRRFDAAGWPEGPEFVVDAARGHGPHERHVMSPALAVLSDSHFVVSWIENRPRPGSAQPEVDLVARVFTMSGQPRDDAFVVRSSFDALIGNHSVVALAGGGFVIAWEVQGEGAAVGIRSQVFTASAHPLGTEFACDGNGIDPRLHALADGGFLLAWAALDGLRAQRFRVVPPLDQDLGAALTDRGVRENETISASDRPPRR